MIIPDKGMIKPNLGSTIRAPCVATNSHPRLLGMDPSLLYNIKLLIRQASTIWNHGHFALIGAQLRSLCWFVCRRCRLSTYHFQHKPHCTRVHHSLHGSPWSQKLPSTRLWLKHRVPRHTDRSKLHEPQRRTFLLSYCLLSSWPYCHARGPYHKQNSLLRVAEQYLSLGRKMAH